MLPGLEKTFGKVEVVQVPGLDGEFGFTTCVMTEGAYEDRAKGYQDQILHMIRIEDLDEAGE